MSGADEHEDDALLLYPEDAPEGDDDDDENDEQDDEASVASELTVPPECSKANALPFCQIVRRMEGLWQLRKSKKKVPDMEKKKYLLPIKLLQALEPQSVFPLLRLLVPDQDNARNCYMKEKLIAQAYCDAEGFSKGTTNHEKLFGFTDPQKVPHTMAGDLSLVVQHVLEQRMPAQPSKCTVGQINQWLDDLAALRQAQRGTHNHDWRSSQGSSQSQRSQSQSQSQGSQNKKKKKQSLASLRVQWLRKIMTKGKLSPLEHKWLVRLLLQKMEFGIGWRSLFNWYNPYAIELWNAHNSLKHLCDKLADPNYTIQRKMEERAHDKNRDKEGSWMASQWEPQSQPAVLGNTISPMLSNRCQFDTCMTNLEMNHKQFLKSYEHQQRFSLKFPAICAEIKLDGERMVIHATREGIVTMQTRNGKWYSEIYAPGLAPCIRKALQKYPGVDVILDGEIEAWDNGRQELISFGNNRTVANCRKNYLSKRNLLDPRDFKLHADAPNDSSIMRAADEFKFHKQSAAAKLQEADEDPGKDCWLQFLVFDVLFVGGPGAKKLFADCGFPDSRKVSKQGGSIVHLPLLDRKKILYRLIDEQPKEVEHCQTMIIRPNGDVVNGREYFRSENPPMEFGHQMTTIDSTQATISGEIPNLDDLDRRRRQGRSNVEISRTRAHAIDDFYRTVVDENRFEGLVFKDLAAPYLFGEIGRKRKCWHKFKPDYEKGAAVDIDVVIVGAYFATGLRHSGKLSHFLCACVDSDDSSTFLTLCKVNGKSVNYDKLEKIMESTGFYRAKDGEETKLGHWFKPEAGEDPVPPFISSRSLQRGTEDFDGWKFNRSKNYPDLWIHPEQSVVLKIFGQEFVETEEYSAGIYLRFPRISKIRLDSVDGDEKKPSEVDSEQDIWHIYVDTLNQRQGYSSASQDSSAENAAGGAACRFLTPEAYGRNPKKRTRKEPISPSKQVPKVEKRESDALAGLSFTVLEGNYFLESSSLEAQEARDDCWYDAAAKVKKKEDVMKYILLHGGSIKVSAENGDSHILGGVASDARVVQVMKGIEFAKSQVVDKPKTKKAIRLNALASIDGVLKWTFAFSLCHHRLQHQRLRESQHVTPDSEQSAAYLDTTSGKVVPKVHHYLARTKAKENVSDEIQNLDNTAETTKAELITALLDIESRNSPEGGQPIPWQSREFCKRSIVGRNALSFHDNPFWPDNKGGMESETHRCIIYPDIFKDKFGMANDQDNVNNLPAEADSERWHEVVDDTPHRILAVLPIARAMGALVTTHLHSGVTHVVCGLKEGKETILSFRSATASDFEEPERGDKLLDYIISHQFDNDIQLVHPVWVKHMWSKGMNGT